MRKRTIWDEPEFMEWFESRPEDVQAMIRRFPPGRPYRLHGGPFPSYIYCYSVADDGAVTMQVDVESPFLPRRVFGVEPEDLQEWGAARLPKPG